MAALLGASTAGLRTAWGIEVGSLRTGDALVRINPDRFFVPASNTKLFSTALALMRLGPDYRFRTVVNAECPPDVAGVLRSDLRLIGGGDPLISARAVPYKKGPIDGNPMQALDDLAAQVAARGVRRIEGDVIGDDRAYVWAPYPDGWAHDDAIWDYGAPVSALTINDNVLTLRLQPREPGLPPAISLSPPLEYFTIDNRVRTGVPAERNVQVERLPGSRQLRIWGSMPAGRGDMRLLIAIDDPALYAARALIDALERHGIAVRGGARALHRFVNEAADLKRGETGPQPAPPGIELAARTSPPLIEVLRIIDKVSQNLHAELALREVARVRRNIGSREAGLEDLQEFLFEAGIEKSEYSVEDGSGLSRLNLVTPAGVVKLLRRMYESPYRDAWISLMPVGAQDGTLDTRFNGHPLASRIHAKTGSLRHVNALSGYVESASRGPLVFSILANNSNAPSAEIRAIVDKIALAIAE